MGARTESSPPRAGQTPEHDALLVEFLRHNDAPCPVCGYNLRNLTRDVCPECGQRFALRIGAADPRFGLFLLLLAPLLMTAGISAVFVGSMLIYGPLPFQFWGAYVATGLGVANAVVAPCLYLKRTFFLRRERRTQRALVVLAWAVNALIVVISFKFGM